MIMVLLWWIIKVKVETESLLNKRSEFVVEYDFTLILKQKPFFILSSLLIFYALISSGKSIELTNKQRKIIFQLIWSALDE